MLTLTHDVLCFTRDAGGFKIDQLSESYENKIAFHRWLVQCDIKMKPMIKNCIKSSKKINNGKTIQNIIFAIFITEIKKPHAT